MKKNGVEYWGSFHKFWSSLRMIEISLIAFLVPSAVESYDYIVSYVSVGLTWNTCHSFLAHHSNSSETNCGDGLLSDAGHGRAGEISDHNNCLLPWSHGISSYVRHHQRGII